MNLCYLYQCHISYWLLSDEHQAELQTQVFDHYEFTILVRVVCFRCGSMRFEAQQEQPSYSGTFQV